MTLLTTRQFFQLYLMLVAIVPLIMLVISWIFTSYFVSKRKYLAGLLDSFTKIINNAAKEAAEKIKEDKNEFETDV